MRGKRLVALCLGAALLPAAAGADWLVTRGGERIETAGPWRLDEARQLVLFKLPSGTLASLRMSEVELEASRQATEEARRPAAEPRAPAAPPPPVAPVLVLTDADVGHVDDRAPRPPADAQSAGEESAGPEGTAPAADETAPATERLAVTSWEVTEAPDYEGVLIRGRLSNQSDEVVVRAKMVVRLRDGEGEVVSSTDAMLTATSLPPGMSSNFRAEFPQVYLYNSVEFDLDGLALSSEPAEVAPATVPALTREQT